MLRRSAGPHPLVFSVCTCGYMVIHVDSIPYIRSFTAQQGKVDVTPIAGSIVQWDYAAYIANLGLGAPVASNWHVTQHMEPRV